MGFLVGHSKGKTNRFSLSQEEIDAMYDSEFCMAVVDLMLETNLAYGDLIRLSSYGVVNRDGLESVVLIDYGATDDIISTYYSGRKY